MSQHFSDGDDFDDVIDFINYWFNPKTLRGLICYIVVICLILYALFG